MTAVVECPSCWNQNGVLTCGTCDETFAVQDFAAKREPQPAAVAGRPFNAETCHIACSQTAHHPACQNASPQPSERVPGQPVAWLRDDGLDEPVACITNRVKEIWLAAWPQQVERYTIPLGKI
jgi:hypothetical protein